MIVLAIKGMTIGNHVESACMARCLHTRTVRETTLGKGLIERDLSAFGLDPGPS